MSCAHSQVQRKSHSLTLTLWFCCPGRERQKKIRELEDKLRDETELLETRQAELEQLAVIWCCTNSTEPAMLEMLHPADVAEEQEP